MTEVPDLATGQRWAEQGTELFLSVLDRTPDTALAEPTALPGWTGRHLVAHVAANAEALLNLAHWARTGEETPMYFSPAQRTTDIEAGARRPATELRRWVAESAGRLADALGALTGEQWSRTVRTAQGRDVPATEIPWMRAREVLVHAVDLAPAALGFTDLPEDFLLALVDDVIARRSAGNHPALVLAAGTGRHTWKVAGHGEPAELHGSLAGVAAYLTGRPGSDLTAVSGAVPTLPAWL